MKKWWTVCDGFLSDIKQAWNCLLPKMTSLLLLLCSSMNHISTHLYLGIIESPSRIPRQTDGPTSWKNSTHQKWTNTTWSCKHELFNFYTLIFLLIERFLKCFRVICILFTCLLFCLNVLHPVILICYYSYCLLVHIHNIYPLAFVYLYL